MIVAIVLAACASESGVARVAHRDALDASITSDVNAVGDALLAEGSGDDDVPRVMRSLDLGASWDPVDLPGAPELANIVLDRPLPDEDLLVVTGWVPGEAEAPAGDAEPSGDAYVWTSTDGIAFQGGHLQGDVGDEYLDVIAVDDVLVGKLTIARQTLDEPDEVRLFRSIDHGRSWDPVELPDLALQAGESTIDLLRDGWRADDGRLVLRLERHSDSGPAVLESQNDGTTWQPGSCPDVLTGDDGRCSVERHGELLVDGHDVSVDDGATWHRADVRSERGLELDQEIPIIDDVVELPGGGWLAAPTNTEPGDSTYGFLLRSEDGRTWEQVIPDSCGDEVTDDRPSSSFSRPFRVAGGWLVSYGCSGLWTDHLYSELYLLDETGRDPRLVVGSRTSPGERYGPKLLVDGAVIMSLSEGAGDDATWLVRLDL